ncbi:hypothetical protein [Hydrococcus rivularis]|uniref:hypothetical protein n=1 Tax=Hydrococcus rivularis TaxID=1616834 RepID=UPI0009F8B26D|nr:hypothetical protein [Hydrococcus rivularis]
MSSITSLKQLWVPIKSSKLFSHPNTLFWFSLSLSVNLYFGLVSIGHGFSQDYIIQDDVRQHVVWLQRFVDPQLFPNDLIADYFQTLAPVGYKFFYWSMAKLGIESILLAKILPLVLGSIATVYLFFFSLKIFPIPSGAFLISLLFNQVIWNNDDLISATPRAFVYPFFAAFLYYLVQRSLIPVLISIALQGLFYPQLLLVEVTILTVRLFRWQRGLPQLSQDRKDYFFLLSGLGVAFVVLLPFILDRSEFSTVVTLAQMKAMPEFGFRGRNQYFGVNPIWFIFMGSSGIKIPLFPSIVWFAFALPFWHKSQLSLAKFVTEDAKILWQIVIASLGMFFLAHLLLPQLHLPSRYTHHSIRFVMPIAAGIVLLVLLESGWRWLSKKKLTQAKFTSKESFLLGLIALFAAIVIIVPAIPSGVLFLFQTWVVGDAPAVYEFLSKQPKDTLVASIAQESDNIPAFSQRSILASREFALAYHPAYYNRIEQRTIDTIRAQYSSDLSVTKSIIKKYGIDFLLIERNSFEPDYLFKQEWLIRSSFRDSVFATINRLEKGEKPALEKLSDHCSVVSTEKFILLEAACITKVEEN